MIPPGVCPGMARGDTHKKAGPKSCHRVLWQNLRSPCCPVLVLSHELLKTWARGGLQLFQLLKMTFFRNMCFYFCHRQLSSQAGRGAFWVHCSLRSSPYPLQTQPGSPRLDARLVYSAGRSFPWDGQGGCGVSASF